ncbi:MAG: AMP-dependent synthetase/ligase, partial [Candidatus Dormibacteraeota bacterium]|nr:AMP-dependent synthetase/ligase [Candidatus Dormibacteraeota bacterium]
VAAGEAVVLLSENRVEWILADLGIQAAGGVTVPVYATSTVETVAKIVANCNARLAIVGATKLAANLPTGVKVVEMDRELARWMADDPPESAQVELKRRLAELKPSDVASIIYTSGTTGDPKGVVLPHSNFVLMARATLEDFRVGEEDSLLSFLPFSHVFERQSGVVIAIMAGAEIWVSRGIDHLAEDIAEVNPTLMLGVPRMFEKIVDRIRDTARRQPFWKRVLFDLAIAGRLGPLGDAILKPVRLRVGGKRLRMFISGGSPLSQDVEAFFWELGIPIYNGWGMTETTSGATANTPAAHRYGTVGRALPGVELKLASDGELLVRGPGVLREYSHNQKATEESLEEGWLRTGDIAEIDPEGFVRITDRKKDLLKTSGGKFIAPQPIEAALQAKRPIETAVLVGDDRPHVTALLVPKWDHLRADLGLDGAPESLVGDERALAAVQKAVDEVNAGLAHWETVKYFRLLPRDFEEAEGERTPSLKIKRAAIRRNYADLIEEMYTDGAKRHQGDRKPAQSA